MNLLKALTPALFILILTGCSDSSDKANGKEEHEDSLSLEEEAALPHVEVAFPELFRHFTSADSSFSNEGFEGGQTEIKSDSADQSISNERIVKFLPFLIFNADSTYAIDLVTDNYVPVERKDKTILAEGGPDFEVGLIDLRNNKRKELLFFGTMGTVMDAKWLDNSTLMIAGANEVSGDSIRPVIWKYEIPAKAWYVYTYDKMIPNDAGSYPRKWLADDSGE
jgi:hypothetical protein